MAQPSGPKQVLAPGQIPLANHNFREFGGINTQAARQAIKDDEFAWLENVMPIGFGNMPSLAQITAALATIAGGRTIYYRREYNISGTNYLFLACTDGSAWQFRASTPYTITQIAAAGTFSGASTQAAQWKNERLLIIDTTGGYRDWDGTTLTNLSGSSSAPSNGTCIATYAGRVWIVTGASPSRTIAYSNSSAYNDFSGAGGSTTITDETLTSSIQQLLVANNFLYFFGIDSINVIADVQVVSAVTVFSNTNIVANSGTDLAQAIVSYYRSIWYMNRSGIYALYGATPRKASDALDGIFKLINFANPVTGGTVVLNNQLCLAFLFTYTDPVLGDRQVMAVYFNKKWFVASQSAAITGIITSHGSSDILFGTLGANVYQCFGNASLSISQTVKTKLWDMGDYFPIKQAVRIGVEATLPGSTGSISATVDTESRSIMPSVNPLSGQFAFTWTNGSGASFSWTNSLGNAFTWLSTGYNWFQSDVQVQGHYLGATLTSTTAGNTYNGLQLQYRKLPAAWGA